MAGLGDEIVTEGSEFDAQGGEQESEILIDESDGQSAEQDGGDDDGTGGEPQQPQADYVSRLERRLGEMETSLRNMATGQYQQQRNPVPQFAQKPPEQWTTQDLLEYNQYTARSEMQRATAEHQWRGRLSEESLGRGNDYDSVINTYLAPIVERNPEISGFVDALPAADKYMLGLLHEVYSRSGGDLVRTVKAIRNAVGARTAGARDVTNAIKRGQKQAAMRVFQGGGGRPAQRGHAYTADDIANMSDAEFRAFEARAAGR